MADNSHLTVPELERKLQQEILELLIYLMQHGDGYHQIAEIFEERNYSMSQAFFSRLDQYRTLQDILYKD